MNWIKNLLGEKDKGNNGQSSNNSPKDKPVRDYSAEMIPLEELYMSEELYLVESLDLPQRESKPNTDVQRRVTQLVETVKSDDRTIDKDPKGPVNPKGAIKPNQGNKVFAPRIPEIEKTLTIIIIENTNETAKEKDKLEMILEIIKMLKDLK